MTTKYTPLADMLAEEDAEQAAAEEAATKQAEAEQAEAQKAAAKQAEDEEAEAEQATADTLAAIRHTAAKHKKDGGYPAITRYMGGLAGLAVTGVLSSVSSTPATQAEMDDLREQVRRLEDEVAFQKDPNAHHSLAAQLKDRNGAVAQATIELLAAQEEARKAREDLAAATTQVPATTPPAPAVTPQVTAHMAEITRLRGELATANQTSTNLQARLTQSETALTAAEELSRSLTAANEALLREVAFLRNGHDQIRTSIEGLPTIDLTNTVTNPMFGGDVKVPLADAKAINEFKDAANAMYNAPVTTA